MEMTNKKTQFCLAKQANCNLAATAKCTYTDQKLRID